MASSKARQNFNQIIVDGMPDLLESAIDFIRRTFEPDDIFDKSELEDWAKANGFEEKQ